MGLVKSPLSIKILLLYFNGNAAQKCTKKLEKCSISDRCFSTFSWNNRKNNEVIDIFSDKNYNSTKMMYVYVLKLINHEKKENDCWYIHSIK